MSGKSKLKKKSTKLAPESVQTDRSSLDSAKADTSDQSQPSSSTLHIAIALVLIAVIVFIYFPVRNYGFVDLDDPQYVSENPHVADGLNRKSINWAFTSIYASYWIPLVWVSHMIDVQLYGLKAGGHHVTNVLFHIANTLLLFALLKRMTGETGRSAFVAALFAVHPLRVESVVWITERRDVLSTLFWLLTTWTYVTYAERRRRRQYVLMVVFFCLGLMAKPMLVTLPFTLLLLDVWPLRRLRVNGWPLSRSEKIALWNLVREKLPLFGLALAVSVLTYFAQKTTGAVADTAQISQWLRVGNALLSYVIYILQTLWPARLALYYPHPKAIAAWQVLISAVGLIVVTIAALRAISRRPYLMVGWFWYLGTLVPVIGLIQAGDQARADRFMYIPLIGLLFMAAWSVPEVTGRKYIAVAVPAILLIAAGTAAARNQVGYWKDKVSLWKHALDTGADSYVAQTNLGIALHEEKKLDEAIEHYRAAIRIRRDFAEAHNDLGVALADKGQIDEAIPEFLEALRAKPNQADSHYNVGVLLTQRGRVKEAVEHFQAALRIDPNYSDASRELELLRRAGADRQ